MELYKIIIKLLTKQSTQLLNQLESLIYTANPELLIYCKDGMPDWILNLLMKYPTANKLSKAKVSAVEKIPYISTGRAQELIANSKKSVACRTDEITEQIINASVKQILNLKQSIKVQTQIMASNCSIPELDILKTFPGIGDYSAIGLFIEIQTINRFANAKKLSSFFGLHPVYKTSGDGKSGFRMSKTGRKEPRQILFMVALNAIKSNSLIRSIYKKHTENGMGKMVAIGLCMHKILRVVYGMLKHNKGFDPLIDEKNRTKIVSNQKVNKDKNRRFQDFDPKAPVSRRQNIKRKERKESHSDNNTKIGIMSSVQSSI